MSRPIPPVLAALRQATQASFGYWSKSKRVSDTTLQCMTATEKKNLYYGPDRELVKRLAEAEREFTESFNPDAAKPAWDIEPLSFAEQQASVIRDTGA